MSLNDLVLNIEHRTVTMPVTDPDAVQKASRGRPRKPESEKKKYVPTGGQKGRPRIHPLKPKSDRGRGRPRINPLKEKSIRPRGRPIAASSDPEVSDSGALLKQDELSDSTLLSDTESLSHLKAPLTLPGDESLSLSEVQMTPGVTRRPTSEVTATSVESVYSSSKRRRRCQSRSLSAIPQLNDKRRKVQRFLSTSQSRVLFMKEVKKEREQRKKLINAIIQSDEVFSVSLKAMSSSMLSVARAMNRYMDVFTQMVLQTTQAPGAAFNN